MNYLLDTNICIYLIKRSPEQVFERFSSLNVGDVAISAITLCELQYGVAKSTRPEQNQNALHEFLGPIDIMDFPASAAPQFGSIRSHLERQGTPIGNYDLLIAAHCLHIGSTLVTNNLKEFSLIPNLRCENWIDIT